MDDFVVESLKQAFKNAVNEREHSEFFRARSAASFKRWQELVGSDPEAEEAMLAYREAERVALEANKKFNEAFRVYVKWYFEGLKVGHLRKNSQSDSEAEEAMIAYREADAANQLPPRKD